MDDFEVSSKRLEKPDTVGDWSLQLQLQLLFPKGG